MIVLFAVTLGWLPSTGRGEVEYVMGIQTSLHNWKGFCIFLCPPLTWPYSIYRW